MSRVLTFLHVSEQGQKRKSLPFNLKLKLGYVAGTSTRKQSAQKKTQEQTMKLSSTAAFLIAAASAPGTTAFAPISRSPITSASSLFSTVDDKTEVREYFNNEGFNRWNKIYSDSDEVNKVQLDIRDGHAQTIQKILNWVEADGDISGKTVCDCGCGVGSLAIPLAQMGE
jgi:ribosomal protein L11 methylase PrmA